MEDNRQTSKRTEYIYAGGRLVAKRVQNLSSNGSNSGSPSTTTIHTDFLGSPVAETSSTGAVIKVERFTPYGEAADLTLDAGPGFTGHATDVATGLTYMQQRYYDAELGRFISPDPVGPEEDFIKHFNRYNYALNNPVRYTDPDGEQSKGLFTRYRTPEKQQELIESVGGDVELMKYAQDTHKDFVFTLGGFAIGGGFGFRSEVATIGTANVGYSSFNAFKAAYGSAGKGNAWHHIVEQGGDNVVRFGAEAIHNAKNIVKLPHGAGTIHAKISGFYSSKQAFTGGKTVRQWLSTQSYQQQYEFGIKTLKQFGWKP